MHKYKYKEYCRVKGKPSYPGLGGRAKPSRDRFTSSKKPRTLCQPFHLSADLIPYIYTLYLTPYTLYLISSVNLSTYLPTYSLTFSFHIYPEEPLDRFTSQEAHSLLSTFTAMLHLPFHLPTYWLTYLPTYPPSAFSYLPTCLLITDFILSNLPLEKSINILPGARLVFKHQSAF